MDTNPYDLSLMSNVNASTHNIYLILIYTFINVSNMSMSTYSIKFHFLMYFNIYLLLTQPTNLF